MCFPPRWKRPWPTIPTSSKPAVIGVPDGEYGQRLRSFVVLRPRAPLTENDVKDCVRQRLARFKVPRDVRLVDELPRNPTGKVVRPRLDTAP
jgi:fatty-acyl-CoA synthase